MKKSNPTRFFENSSHYKADERLEAYARKIRERHQQGDRLLDSMNPVNPLRIAGELLHEQLKRRDHRRLGTMALKGHEKSRTFDLER